MDNNITRTQGKYSTLSSLAMMGVVFFIMGFVSWVNSILIPFFKIACQLSTFQSYFVTLAFYIAYLVMAIPVSHLLKKTGYKRGMMLGFFMLAIGAATFIPAALMRTYGLFLTGLFIMGSGLTILQASANPYVTILGPIESAARRISIVGVCNKFAGIISPLIFSAFVLGRSKAILAQIEEGVLAGRELDEALGLLLDGVIMPYGALALILVGIGAWIFFSPIPDINPDTENVDKSAGTDRSSVMQYPYLVLGVLALFFHVGSQVIAIDTIINYAGSMGIDLIDAKVFPSFTLGATLVGYLLGITLIPWAISQKNALIACTVTGLILSCGVLFMTHEVDFLGHRASISLWFLAALGFPNSLIYAGIWPHAIRNLGRFTKVASSMMVMALCGNAIMPQIYAAISEKTSLHTGYWILIPCYLYLIWYAVWGYRITTWKRTKKQ